MQRKRAVSASIITVKIVRKDKDDTAVGVPDYIVSSLGKLAGLFAGGRRVTACRLEVPVSPIGPDSGHWVVYKVIFFKQWKINSNIEKAEALQLSGKTETGFLVDGNNNNNTTLCKVRMSKINISSFCSSNIKNPTRNKGFG